MNTFYEYAGCDTCKKAKKWLASHDVKVNIVPIVESPPSRDELTRFIAKSGLPAKKWINTSGQSYRALVQAHGKDAVDAWTDAKLIAAFAKDGKLIKRPVLVTKSKVLVGFRDETYKTELL